MEPQYMEKVQEYTNCMVSVEGGLSGLAAVETRSALLVEMLNCFVILCNMFAIILLTPDKTCSQGL